MPLHRLTVPGYFGGLPGTHDYINDPAANGDPGVPVAADTKKSSGVNEGTYFVAFSEPATSLNTNRGFQALSQNTDYLDDVVHRDLATPTLTATATAVGPVSSLVLSGITFVGAPGATNDQRTRTGLVSVVDADGLPVLSFDGLNYSPVLVSLIHDGASNNVIGTSYYTNPTVNFTPAIPNAQTYRLSFYARDTLVAQDESVLTRYRNGVNGFATLWAYARDTRDGLVAFTGDKSFSDTVSFNGLVAFYDDVGFNDPVVFNDLVTSNNLIVLNDSTPTSAKISNNIAPGVGHFFLLQQYRYRNAPAAYARLYTSDQTLGLSSRGFAITANASYNPGTGLWTADDTTAVATLTIFGTDDVRTLTKFPTTVPWLTTAWDITSGTSVGGAQTSMGAAFRSILGAAFIEQQGGGFPGVASFVQYDDANNYLDHYVPVLSTRNTRTTGTENGAGRIYLAAGDGAASPGTHKGFIITHNAVWMPATREWQADDPGSEATMLIVHNGVELKYRGNTLSPWDDANWSEFTDAFSDGDLITGASIRAEEDIRAGDDVVAFDNVIASNGNIIASNGDAEADAFRYNSPSSKRVTIPIDEASVIAVGASYWAGGFSNDYWELIGAPGSILSFPFRVPKNYEVTEVRVLVNRDNGGGAANMQAYWYRFDNIVWTYGSEATAADSLVGSDFDSGNSLESLIISGSETLDTDSGWYSVYIPGTNVGDRVFGVSYVFTDLGPQNF
jgi:hypothetical protein